MSPSQRQASKKIMEINHFRIAPGVSLTDLSNLAQGRVGALAGCCEFSAYKLGRINDEEYVEIVEWDGTPRSTDIDTDERVRAFRAVQRPPVVALGKALTLVDEYRAF